MLDDWWCQGFSEPGAGSDLAGLRTRAERSGDEVGRQRAEDLDHARAARGLDFLLRAHRSGGEEAGRHLVPADGHERRRASPCGRSYHRRRPGGERGVLRQGRGAGGEPGRRRRTRAGITRSSCSATNAPASPGSARRRREWRASSELAALEAIGERPLIEDPKFREKLAAVEIELKALEMTQLRVVADERANASGKPNPACSDPEAEGLGDPAAADRADDGSRRSYVMPAPQTRRAQRAGDRAGVRRRRRRRPISTCARSRSTAAPTRSSAISSPKPSWGCEPWTSTSATSSGC